MKKFLLPIICLFFSCYPRAENIPWISLIPAQKVQFSPFISPASQDVINTEVNKTIKAIWEFYKIYFKRELNDDEHTHRFYNFHANVVRIMKHNGAYEQGLVEYRMGLNEFTDKSKDELAHLRGLKVPKHPRLTGSTFLSSVPSHFLPSSVDWRLVGAVTEVKNQGHCGSCWAFSTTGAVEGQHFRKFKKLVNLSEQQLVDCSKANHGCQGGIMDAAFQYVRESGGLDTEEEYPYVSGQSGESNNCTFHKEDVVATVSGFIDLPKSDEDALKEAVALHGPISVAINAGQPSFMSYHSGVYSDPDCDDNLDHGVLLVGYGEERGIPYWLIKNSWGEQWGDQGYVKIKRNADNMCGVASMASYPLI